ncbi:MAG TPA: mechanosensitive ion channel family protein [Candidatus Angelobacter sp.]|nr:mechanosensitive ion channel family protein [Candidatus Angelobacter sp.]
MTAAQTWLPLLTAFALKVLGAIVLWFVGRWLIKFGLKLLGRALDRQSFDRTLVNYIQSAAGILLNIILVVALLGYFGVQTASFAALLVGVGLAIGAAWSGLLANFAAGLFLLVLRPFKVADFVEVGGVIGTVEEIGLFTTRLTTPANVMAIVGNAKIFSDTIQNYTRNDYRRVDLTVQLAHEVNPLEAIALLKKGIAPIPNVLAVPSPIIEIFEFTLAGPVLIVRPFCANQHYWQVYFDTNRMIRSTFGQAGFPAPEHHQFVHGVLEGGEVRTMKTAA